jgi:hypothetical protein
MEYFQLQGRLGLFEPVHSSSRRVSKNQSSLVLGIIVLVHAVLILLVLNEKVRPREIFPFERIIQLVQLQPEKNISISEPEKPIVDVKTSVTSLTAPALSFKDSNNSKLDLSLPQSDSLYELPDGTEGQYKDVFDPKLRKKLQEAHANRKPKKQNTINTWETSGGTTLVDMGDGECIASMPKVDSRQRGTNWSMLRVKCGKTDSEKMMDNVTADLEARKHPLNKKGQQ